MKKLLSAFILTALFIPILSVSAQPKTNPTSFSEIKILLKDGESTDEKSVVVSFEDDSMKIKSKKGEIDKTFEYSDIKKAEYSYSKNPRWKTGLGLGAASVVFPPLLLVAIPLGFTKHKRHWVTIQTADDYAVLKLSKSNRKMFIPTFETKTGISVEAVGDDK